MHITILMRYLVKDVHAAADKVLEKLKTNSAVEVWFERHKDPIGIIVDVDRHNGEIDAPLMFGFSNEKHTKKYVVEVIRFDLDEIVKTGKLNGS